MSLRATPKVTTRSGQRAVIEMIREFRYPTAFEVAGEVQILTPTVFEMETVGVTLEVESFVREGGLIELTAIPRLKAFQRFVAYAGGKTQPPGPIPRDGFTQPIFDYTNSIAGATLRSGQTLVVGGFEWHGPDATTLQPGSDPSKVGFEAGPAEERQLLFVTLTARLVAPQGGGARDAKVGGPVLVTPKLTCVSRDRLLAWIGAGQLPPSGGEGTRVDVVDADHAEALRQAFGGALGNVLSAELLGQPGGGLVGVIAPDKIEALLKALEAVSGGPVWNGSSKAMALHERYFAEVGGVLRYRPKSPATVTPGQSVASADTTTGQVENVDLRLAVEALCAENGAIDLNVISTLTTTPQPGQDSAAGRLTGGPIVGWKLLDEPPRWTKPAVTTSVTVWSGSTVVFVKASDGQPDHLQLLLITVSGTPLREGAAPSEATKTPAADGEKAQAQKWPTALPVPGKTGFVTSPYAPEKGYVDVRGFPSGTEIRCPYSHKTFLVP